jgi:hypothetical protein
MMEVRARGFELEPFGGVSETGVEAEASRRNPERSALGAKSKDLEKKKLVGARGFEPPTPCAQGRCATRLRYAPTK